DGEVARREGAPSLGEPEDATAGAFAEKVRAIETRPQTVGNKGATPDAVAARGAGGAGDRRVVLILEDRVYHVRRSGGAGAGRVVGVTPFAAVPTVVGARLGDVDLLPGVLAHVVDEDARAGVVGIGGDAEGIAEPPGEGLLTLIARRGAAGDVAARRARSLEGVGGGNAAVLGDAQQLAGELVLVPRRVVLPRAAAACVITTTVADRGVEKSVPAKNKVARVVVAGRRGHVVDQHRLARRVNDIGV